MSCCRGLSLLHGLLFAEVQVNGRLKQVPIVCNLRHSPYRFFVQGGFTSPHPPPQMTAALLAQAQHFYKMNKNTPSQSFNVRIKIETSIYRIASTKI